MKWKFIVVSNDLLITSQMVIVSVCHRNMLGNESYKAVAHWSEKMWMLIEPQEEDLPKPQLVYIDTIPFKPMKLHLFTSVNHLGLCFRNWIWFSRIWNLISLCSTFNFILKEFKYSFVLPSRSPLNFPTHALLFFFIPTAGFFLVCKVSFSSFYIWQKAGGQGCSTQDYYANRHMACSTPLDMMENHSLGIE